MMVNRLTTLGALLAAILPLAAAAQTKPKTAPAVASPERTGVADPGPAKALGTAGSWTAYLAQNKEGKVCYVAGQPSKTDPSIKRAGVMATVTHRTADQVVNVVSFAEGYPLNENANVLLEVGKDRFTLFAKDDSAWAATADLDKAIVTALGKEKRAVVRGTPKKGHATTDIYSLDGFPQALALIDKACDVKR